jgi:hypothetical protein
MIAGCEEQPRVTQRPQPGQPQAQQPPVAQAPQVQPREVLGKTTQEVRPAQPELERGAQVAQQKVTAKDPITMGGNVYVVSVDRIAAGNVKHAIDLWQADHDGRYPKDTKEFMDEIIKPGQPDGMRLPQLPYYQEYGYDEKEHKLIVLEYPERKVQFQQRQDKRLGRQ